MEEEAQAAEASTQAPVNNTPVYEVGFHLVPTVAEGDVGEGLEKIRQAIEATGGVIISQEVPKRMTLAYRIERSLSGKVEKYTESWFGWVKFEIEDEKRGALPELEAALRGMKDVLRFIVVSTVRESAVPPPRALYSSDRLEGETIKTMTDKEEGGEVSEEELDKSIEALVQ